MTAWFDDPSNDLDWNNYSAGWDTGRADAIAANHDRDLTGHGQPFCDGYADGWQAANHR